eukprot:TRINITY_DN1410_c0_g1_i2.p6 TRINITY_DN1410_c0_g1~~TRINITY_DN1410_c0_g1_i2.p6  ORF type:complete len:121 (-),score=26.00 TRINITY_DN1410_c0_g1_i2:1040-1402(-)
METGSRTRSPTSTSNASTPTTPMKQNNSKSKPFWTASEFENAEIAMVETIEACAAELAPEEYLQAENLPALQEAIQREEHMMQENFKRLIPQLRHLVSRKRPTMEQLAQDPEGDVPEGRH